MADSVDEDDGIHPLDRDYAKPVPSVRKRLIFTDSRGINLGILGFGFGGVVLLIGIVLSQFGQANRTLEAMAGSAHRLGLLSILFGGVCIIFTMQTRADKPRRARKRDGDVLICSITAKSGNPEIGLRDWQCALSDFDYLIASQLTSDCLTPELQDVYLNIGGCVLAVLRWDCGQQGVIRVRLRRGDLTQVMKCSRDLLGVLGANLVDDKTGVHY